MLTFSRDPQVAEKQMQAIIFSLTTFGHIDGDFDDRERAFVKEFIGKLVTHRVATGMPEATPEVKRDVAERFTKHFHETFENIERWVAEVMSEPISKDDSRDEVVHAKLKLRCFELFKSFDRASQEAVLETVDEFILADGHSHPAETKFRSELAALLGANDEVPIEVVDDASGVPVRLSEPIDLRLRVDRGDKADHPFFKQFEHHYSSQPERIQKQVQADLALVDRMIDVLAEQRSKGAGKLEGKKTVQELEGGDAFLDGHVYVMPMKPGRRYELVVLGDLHGCYSCLKAAIMQTRFFEKVEAFRRDPDNAPEPKLVLLGDYIDRGIFSLNGVLRTVMQLFVTAPDHVCVLRGNHEYYVEYKGQIYGGVKPAEAINTLKPYLPLDVFRRYMALFEAMPNVLLAGSTMFVHAGIPRDRLIKERWKDLSSLNDQDMRFQMMWSDPAHADVIPAALQEQTARFPFGRLQLQAFLSRIGCNALVRGHEKVEAGYERVYDDPNGTLITLFSAGGAENQDLPESSSYRSVTPKAMLVTHQDGTTEMAPFDLDWRSYNDPAHNAFFKNPMEIEHRVE
ncbi:metallophosphoesterase family protein [Sandaracinus amylolyticus]|uniref:metallophosphoesterase family protein n=1 Tax=Sandaracinus amylolyticus TaxID=927083 RepID=UPI001F1E9132|nr:metallophosphoesterase family protein [Sandaracinus amylolyticus]UJR81644.1 Diadenosine tetraphosphatase [Sandaracinus amylolyticus]